MEFISELKKAAPEGDTLVTIGVFDGVHRGHQHLIKRLVASAKERGYSSGVITFHPNPVTVVRPGTKVAYLTDIEERIELIKALSVDFVAPVTFTPELSQLTAREFVSLLMEHLHLRGLVVGDDFALGRGREGTIQVLTGLGQDMGFTVDVVAQHDIEGQRVTSSAIRAALAEGDIATVSAFLGHPYTIKGVVVPGAERGRVLGFPTANLSVWEEKGIPGDGIYATKIHVNSSFCNSATYVGTRPTFGEGGRVIEVFILDFEGDLYGHEVKLEWVQRIRGDMRFDSHEALREQMERDVEQVRATLGSNS